MLFTSSSLFNSFVISFLFNILYISSLNCCQRFYIHPMYFEYIKLISSPLVKLESPWWSIGILIMQLGQIIGYVEKIKSFCLISTLCWSYRIGSNWSCNRSIYVNFFGSILGIATNLFTLPILKGMDSQDNISLYVNILQFDSNFEVQVFGKISKYSNVYSRFFPRTWNCHPQDSNTRWQL